MKVRALFAPLALALLVPDVASAQQIIVNGGFEGGLTGWWIANAAGGSGNFYLSSSTVSPVSGSPTPGPRSGLNYAVTDQTAPGAHALFQTFTLGSAPTSATLSFWYFNRTSVGPLGAQNDFSFTGPANQRVQIDLLSGDISGDPFGGTVLANFFTGAGNTGWTFFTQDITGLLGAGTYSLRFAQVDNQNVFQHGVDDVSLNLSTISTISTVPEPSTTALLGFGLISIAAYARRRLA